MLYTDSIIEQLWDEFGDITLMEDKTSNLILSSDWHIFLQGTCLEDIWYWFDKYHSKGVGWLMHERINLKEV